MVLGDIEYGDLVWLRLSALNGAYKLSIRPEQGGVEPHREYVSWVARLDPPPLIALGLPLDMALIYDEPFQMLLSDVGLRTAFVMAFGFVELPPL